MVRRVSRHVLHAKKILELNKALGCGNLLIAFLLHSKPQKYQIILEVKNPSHITKLSRLGT